MNTTLITQIVHQTAYLCTLRLSRIQNLTQIYTRVFISVEQSYNMKS